MSPFALIGRAVRLRCPKCGKSPLVQGWTFKMHSSCSQCGLDFQREPGFYLGSIYINYGLTSATVLVLYVLLAFVFDASMLVRIVACLSVALLLPILLFRRSRSAWLAMDCLFDQSHTEK